MRKEDREREEKTKGLVKRNKGVTIEFREKGGKRERKKEKK